MLPLALLKYSTTPLKAEVCAQRRVLTLTPYAGEAPGLNRGVHRGADARPDTFIPYFQGERPLRLD